MAKVSLQGVAHQQAAARFSQTQLERGEICAAHDPGGLFIVVANEGDQVSAVPMNALQLDSE